MHTANSRRSGAFVLLVLLATLFAAAANVIPVDQPPPDAMPPAKDKPVKVEILSGHLSVWMESAKLPSVAREIAAKLTR